jgi:NAD(P)-dependent dehydrogenase (short-subunit alcohol dehydrogenase family)
MFLKDKVCVISGASSLRGIGYAVAELFVQQGAKVVVTDISMSEQVVMNIRQSIRINTGLDPDITGYKCDITSPLECKQLADEILKKFGMIDSLINSAGIVQALPFLEIKPEDLHRLMHVNFTGTFNMCSAFAQHFSQAKRGNIVNIASIAGEIGGGLLGGAHYASSKGAMMSLTRSIARELGPLGVRANTICPAMTDTAMIDVMSEERHAELIKNIPLKRSGKPKDIAGACLFLASEELSGYVTGATLDVNGGTLIH